MAGKPDWLSRLEEEQSEKLIKNDQANEIAASHKRILATEAPDLWEKVKQAVYDALKSSELRGLIFSTQRVSDDSLMVRISKTGTISPEQVIYINYSPLQYKFEVIDSSGRSAADPLYLAVSGGRLVLSDGSRVIPDKEADGLTDTICQLLLEPVLKPYI